MRFVSSLLETARQQNDVDGRAANIEPGDDADDFHEKLQSLLPWRALRTARREPACQKKNSPLIGSRLREGLQSDLRRLGPREIAG